MKTEHLRFAGPDGGELAARLEAPDAEPAAYAHFAHCFTCTTDLRAARRIGRALAERGIALLAIDFTGLGESAGEFAASNFSSNVRDLVAAADFLRTTRRAPALLVGHSLGGAAVLAAAAQIPEAVAVATVGAPSSTEHLREKLLKLAPDLAVATEAEVDLGGPRRFKLRRQLLDDLGHDPLHAAVVGLGRALLILHSPLDAIVGIDHARRLFDAAHHPKSFVSLAGADHLLSNERDA
ncbi:MAG TPA: alpha/beta fold hydrolase, partial [Thermoanaerobaculia bacterium]